ncbi:S1 family peptidase [Alistipes sp.]|uniref:S1 family peptidase n=1 Tax=Alistipes sp. TaxID=1872444 RepID=UPI003AF07754
MAIIPNIYINAVVSIGIRNQSKCVSWIGSGFFVIRKVDDKGNARPFLITNKHVLGNQSTIVLRMKEHGSTNLREIDAPLNSSEGHPLYKTHPTAQNIDIAILPLDGSFITSNNLEFPAFDIDDHAMASGELINNGVDEGSLVYMLGFPMGLVNKDSKVPICRLGCVARLCSEQIKETYNVLLDIQNFPGNSGSPIVSRPELMSIGGTPSLNRSVLMGIVHSYIPYRETLINSQTNEVVEVRSENSGIANMHPVEYIRDIIDTIQPKLEIKSDK